MHAQHPLPITAQMCATAARAGILAPFHGRHAHALANKGDSEDGGARMRMRMGARGVQNTALGLYRIEPHCAVALPRRFSVPRRF